jgi:hypothetical protein
MIYRCQSGRHCWTDKRNAWRCCSGKWRREVRPKGAEGDLDPFGRDCFRMDRYVLIYGWVLVGPAIRHNES